MYRTRFQGLRVKCRFCHKILFIFDRNMGLYRQELRMVHNIKLAYDMRKT